MWTSCVQFKNHITEKISFTLLFHKCLGLRYRYFAEMEAVLAVQEVADQKEEGERKGGECGGEQGEEEEEEEEGIPNEEGVETGEETVESLKKEVALVRKQLGEAKSEGAVAQLLQENVESMEKRNRSLEEELATTQMLLSEAMEGDQANVVARLKSAYKKLQTENQDLKIQLRLGEQGSKSGVGGGGTPAGGGSEGLLGATVISDVTKSLARRVKSSVAQTVAGGAAASVEEKDHLDSEANSLRAMVSPRAPINRVMLG